MERFLKNDLANTGLLDRCNQNRQDFLRQENRFSLRLACYRSPDSSQTTLPGQAVNVLLAPGCGKRIRVRTSESGKCLKGVEKKIFQTRVTGSIRGQFRGSKAGLTKVRMNRG
jgi:hypothetical protein